MTPKKSTTPATKSYKPIPIFNLSLPVKVDFEKIERKLSSLSDDITLLELATKIDEVAKEMLAASFSEEEASMQRELAMAMLSAAQTTLVSKAKK